MKNIINILLTQFINPSGGGMTRAVAADLNNLLTFSDTKLLVTHEYENFNDTLLKFSENFQVNSRNVISLYDYVRETGLGKWYNLDAEYKVLKSIAPTSISKQSDLLVVESEAGRFTFWFDNQNFDLNKVVDVATFSENIDSILQNVRVVTGDSAKKKWLLRGHIQKIKFFDDKWKLHREEYFNGQGNIVFASSVDSVYGRAYQQFFNKFKSEAVFGEQNFKTELLDYFAGKYSEINVVVQDIGLAPAAYPLVKLASIRKLIFVFHAAHFKWHQRNKENLRATESSLLLDREYLSNSKIHIVTKTEKQAEDMKSSYPYLKGQVESISNYFEDVEHPIPAIQGSDRTLYFISRFASEKRPLDAVRVFSEVKKSWQKGNLYLKMIGDGPLLNLVRLEIQKLGLEDDVRLYGYTTAPWDLVKTRGVFLMTSFAEGQSYTVYESIQRGIPVAMYPVPYVSNVDILEKNNSSISETESINSLTESVLELLENDLSSNRVASTVSVSTINSTNNQQWQALLGNKE